MTPEEFTAWRQRLGYTKTEAAAALGLSPNMPRYYERGDTEIPRYIALACAAVSYGLQPMGTQEKAPAE